MSTNLVGQILLGQFRVDSFVAAGGMGAVYRVWDMHRNVPLAMKVLHAELAEDPSMFKRFKREANALKKLTHPNIVPFYGLFEQRDTHFLLQHFVDGPTLKEVLKQQGGKPLRADQALIYLKAIAAALGYAHANGVVHCDVKPGNVMIDQGGGIYLTDFGIARHSESTTTTLGFAGTAAYMSPEQCRGEMVSPATDVYALGVMLYEMLTGARPFRDIERDTTSSSPTAERLRQAHINTQPPDPRQYNPALPEELAGVILQALAKQPEERYASARELYEAACIAVGINSQAVPDRAILSQKSRETATRPSAEKTSPASQAIGTSPEMGRTTPSQVLPWLAGGTGLLIVVGVIGLIATVVGVLAINGQRQSTSSDTAHSQSASSNTSQEQVDSPAKAGIQLGEHSTKEPARPPTLAPTTQPVEAPTLVPTIAPSPTLSCAMVSDPFGTAWRQVRDGIGCSAGGVVSGLIAQEDFEHGMMFWREPIDFAQAVVLFNDGTWRIFKHTPYVEGSPEYSCVDANTPAQTPPTPRRGFGMMWCDIPEIRAGLGNATNNERGYQGYMQQFDNGFMLTTSSSTVVVFYNTGSWEQR